MGLIQLSRGLIISLVLGLAFTIWVDPGTTGGLLLLLAVSTGVIYFLGVLAYLIWLGVNRRAKGGKEVQAAEGAPTFRSKRGGADVEAEKRERPN